MSGTDSAARLDKGFDPETFEQRTFYDKVPGFLAGKSSPRDFLEECIATIEEREPVVQAWTSLRIDDARKEADASAQRYRDGRPLSTIDGMPVGVKDLISTRDLPTTLGVRDNFVHTGFDSAMVQALRAAGAIIVGKASTAELGLADNPPTTNAFDRFRTPGGSSSGSGAAVGARMIPAAIGSQVGGSLIKPAAYNGNYANRPSQGGLHRGERQGYSASTMGVHAGSLADMWHVTSEITKRVGGDPGFPGVFGPTALSEAVKPKRLMVVETCAWPYAEPKVIEAFELFVERLRAAGIDIVRRKDDPLIEYFEEGLVQTEPVCLGVMAWENRWNFENLELTMGDKLRSSFRTFLESARQMTLSNYRLLLVQREELKLRTRAMAPLADAILTLSAPVVAPHLSNSPYLKGKEGSMVPYGTAGHSGFNYPASVLGLPAISLPLAAIDGMPVGFQILGQQNEDDRITGLSRWIAENIPPVKL